MIAVWFSCGAASAVAAKKTIDKYGDKQKIRIINNPIKEEHPDNQRFLKDVENWLGLPIEFATNVNFPNASIEEVFAKGFMGNRFGAPCTLELKKKARQQWENINKPDFTVLGFTYEEQGRFDRFKKYERDTILPVLIEDKITKADCFKILNEAGIKLPEIYSLGFPNANCIGCVKATSPTYWNHVRKTFPKVFKKRAEQSREIGAKLTRVKNKRIYLDELDPKQTGNKMKNMNIECGIFCEDWKLL